MQFRWCGWAQGCCVLEFWLGGRGTGVAGAGVGGQPGTSELEGGGEADVREREGRGSRRLVRGL